MTEILSVEDLVKPLAVALRAAAIYGAEHPIASRSLNALGDLFEHHLRSTREITMVFLGDDVVVGRTRLRASANLQGLVRQFRELNVDKITFDRECGRPDLSGFVLALSDRTERSLGDRLTRLGVHGITLGLLELEEAELAGELGILAARHVYSAAVAAAERTWTSALTGEVPDAEAARAIIDTLAKALTQDRTSMLALTSIKTHDPYTFTHMVNVSLLVMAQARSLGLPGPLVREFGLAGLMHDVGKTRIPAEILTKPSALTGEELLIIRRHVVDGAQILRKAPGMPALAPVVAFEHHLRLDLSGYPEHIGARKLNLCTMLTSIADVFDALRSNRAYRDGLPTDRVRCMLAEQSGKAFEPTLLRRFTTLMGLFPVGTSVRLRTGEVGLVVQEHLSIIDRPVVRLLKDSRGDLMEAPITVDTAERGDAGTHVHNVLEAVDPDSEGIVPLEVLSA